MLIVVANKEDAGAGPTKGPVIANLVAFYLQSTPRVIDCHGFTFNFALSRLRRFIRITVAFWFAGIVFAVLVVIVLFVILLLNINVTDVGDPPTYIPRKPLLVCAMFPDDNR